MFQQQVDNLRYSWQRLLGQAMDVNVLLLTMQPHFEEDLRRNLDRFRQDNIDYCHEYRTSGPMMPGLTPREASDRLILFQVLTSNNFCNWTLVSQTLAWNIVNTIKYSKHHLSTIFLSLSITVYIFILS